MTTDLIIVVAAGVLVVRRCSQAIPRWPSAAPGSTGSQTAGCTSTAPASAPTRCRNCSAHERLDTFACVHDPDVAAALREVRRVLKPAGTLHFVEHGLAPDERVRRWQHRLEPIQNRAFGGCHLTRPVVELLTSAGFTIAELDVFYEDGAPKFLAADSLGTAVSP